MDIRKTNIVWLIQLTSIIWIVNSIVCVKSFENLMKVNSINAPSKLSNCKAKLDDNTIIDLTSLDNANNPR